MDLTMSKTYTTLPVVHLKVGTSFSHPPNQPEIVHLDDPALHVMIDFRQANAIIISPDVSISEAAMEMRVCHTHLLLVTNKDHLVIGLISSEDIMGEKPLKVTRERQIRRDEILVRMVMTRQEQIVAFDNNDVRYSKVGNVVQTLHEAKQHYALVIEIDPVHSKQMVRGLFSLSQISKQLGYDVTSDLSEAHSLAELQRNLRNNHK
jgi:predicted transcriptional regulator